MTAAGDLVFAVGVFVGPLLAVVVVLALVVAQQPRWVLLAGAAGCGVLGIAWVAYWLLWGKAFQYADADTYQPVPAAINQASEVAIGVCLMTSLAVVGLGAARLIDTWRRRMAGPQTRV